jgi:hypothetical protein
MTDTFVKYSPDELGEALQALAQDEKSKGDMLETLMRSKAFTLLDRPAPEGVEPDEGVRVLTVEDPRGEARMMGLFTSAEKARASGAQSPEFEHLAQVEVIWAFLKLEDQMGVVLNPDDDRSFRIPPEVAANLKQAVQQAVNQ